MNNLKQFLVGIIVLGAVVSVPVSALSLEQGLESFLRYSVMRSANIVVGEVIETAPYERTVPNRVSTVVVDEVIHGGFSAGDSISVQWSANRWYPSGGGVGEVACAGTTQLDTLTGRTALWLLSESDGVRSTGPPILFGQDSRARLGALISYVEEPDTTNMGIATLLRLHAELAAKPDSQEKCSAFTAFLRRCLDERSRVTGAGD